MIAGSANHNQTGLQDTHLLEQRLSRLRAGFHNVQLIFSSMKTQELPSVIDVRIRCSPAAVNIYKVNRFVKRQAQKLKYLKRPRHLSAASICDEDPVALREFPGHNHDRARTSAYNLTK